MKHSRFVLFGVDSSFSVECIETLRRLGRSVAAGVLTGPPEWDLQGVEVLCEEHNIGAGLLALPVVVPWVTPSRRIDRVDRATQAGFSAFETLVDPTAVLASNATLGQGVFINAGAIIGADVMIGDHAVINRSGSVGHHSTIGEFASVGPGAVVASKCQLRRAVFIGAGATVAPGITIGADSTLAVGTIAVRDVASGVTVAGNPARPLLLGGASSCD